MVFNTWMLFSCPLRTPSKALCVFQDWKPGSVCRAVFSEDGLVYPAVVLWVKGQRCRVRFDNYNNEEEKDVGSLLRHNELHGSGRPPAAKVSKPGPGSQPTSPLIYVFIDSHYYYYYYYCI